MYLSNSHKGKAKLVLISFFLLAILLNLTFPLFAQGETVLKNLGANSNNAIPKELAEIKNNTQLPIGSVSIHEVPGAKGTAIVFLQDHIYPGSKPQDKINDAAVSAQNQIYQVMDYLYQKLGIKTIMAEGDMYGSVPSIKVTNLAEKIKEKNSLSNSVDQLVLSMKQNNVDPKSIQSFSDTARQSVNSIDREIILSGAPYVLSAENPSDITLYGSENKDTYMKSAQIVQHYMALENLEKQGSLSMMAMGKEANIPFSLNQPNNSRNLETALNQIKENSQCNSNPDIMSSINKIQSDYNAIQKTNQDYSQAMNQLANQTQTSLPQEQINPMLLINKQMLKSELDKVGKEVQDVVIGQRNQETAQNFAAMLKSNNTNIGEIEFGAGHEDGLVKALNDQKISVVVIKTQEVADWQSSQPAQ